MRRSVILLLVVLVVVGLLVGADRVAAGIAGGQAASRLQTSQGLAATPSVRFAGFPFLTQAVSGTYSDIVVDIDGLTRDGLRLEHIRAHLQGVHAPLSRLRNGTLASLPVNHAAATVTLTYADLDAYLATHVTGAPRVAYGGRSDVVAITGGVRVPAALRALPGVPATLNATADASVSLTGSTLVLTPTVLRDLPTAIPAAVRSAVVAALTVRQPLTGLPFGVTLTGVHASSAGIVLSAAADSLVVPLRSGA